ncbi:MAG TPA: hypothetical protein VM370_12925 [Candidatus Thermoplasmatota archaeon]|nr:hypothetical protein [Candidatus Thermoplasmatota archaeon]
MKLATVFLLLILVAAPMSGCLKKGKLEAANLDQQKIDDLLGKEGRDKLIDAASLIPKNYSFAGQEVLPPAVVEFVGKIGAEANGALETEKDEGGIERNAVIQTQDISALLPDGQPVELVIDLIWDASEANSADLDIVVDVPGTRTSYSPTSETLNWNLAVKTIVVNTIGVSGQPALVGIEAAGGAVTSGFDYNLTVRATYVRDVLTPYHAWAFDVPPGASGIILESEKAGGDEHVTSQFVILDPEDNLVQFVDFNDIDIPTQSVFIPTSKPGTYVFYAYTMHGGFFRVKADVPLDSTAARPLALVETKVADASAPAPGIAGKDLFNGSLLENTTPKDDVSPVVVDFAPTGAFPLRITGYITGALTTQAKITLKSPLGTVHTLTKIARYEDESGSIGYTSTHEGSQNNLFDWSKIQRGAWTAEIVNTNSGVEIGHTILTYVRS